MKALLSCSLVVLLSCLASAEDKKEESIDGKKLVGKWRPKEEKKGGDPNVIEFTKDGKLVVTSTTDDKFKTEGNYKVDGKKIKKP